MTTALQGSIVIVTGPDESPWLAQIGTVIDIDLADDAEAVVFMLAHDVKVRIPLQHLGVYVRGDLP